MLENNKPPKPIPKSRFGSDSKLNGSFELQEQKKMMIQKKNFKITNKKIKQNKKKKQKKKRNPVNHQTTKLAN